MPKKLTSGPFFVPLSIDGDKEKGKVEFLLIGFKNVADRPATVQLSVLVCRDPFLYPGTSPEDPIPIKIDNKPFTKLPVNIPAGRCTVVKVDAGPDTFQGNNMLRVTIEGDTDEDAEAIIVALSGGKMDGRTAVSMVFKHEDFIELDDD